MLKLLLYSTGILVLVSVLPCRAYAQSAEQISSNTQASTDQLVMRALDGGAIFTLAGDLKPMSDGIWSTDLESPDLNLTEIDRVRRAMAVFNNENFYGDVITFTHAFKNHKKRNLVAVVFNLKALSETIERHRNFFGPYGLTKSSHPLHVAVTVEHMPDLERHRGYGYLFGYPDHAVDFFVSAEREWKTTGKFVERDFIRIDTFGPSGTNWAVPKNGQDHQENRTFIREAERINVVYKSLREKWGDQPTRLLVETRKLDELEIGSHDKR